MGACETLEATGLSFLAELNAPFTDENGNPLAPLALALETYGRNPDGKHKVMDIFVRQGYDLPDTPIMAFHRGDVVRLKDHLQRNPRLIDRRFRTREIYPPELGCANRATFSM